MKKILNHLKAYVQMKLNDITDGAVTLDRPYGYIEYSDIYIDGKINDILHIVYNTITINGYTIIDLVKECGFCIVVKDGTKASVVFGKVYEVYKLGHRVTIMARGRVRLKSGILGFSTIKYVLNSKLEPYHKKIIDWPFISDIYKLRRQMKETSKFLDTWTIQELIDTYKILGAG